MSIETFDQIVANSQISGDYNPTWKRFVKTRFFVPLLHPVDSAAVQGGQFKLSKHPQSGKTTVTIAERDEQLGQSHTVHLSGAEIVKLLLPEVGILIALDGGRFGIPAGLVARLRQSLETSATKARPAAGSVSASSTAAASAAGSFPSINADLVPLRAASQQMASAAAPAQARPGTLALESIATASAPVSVAKPQSKPASTYLDVAALRPRSVGIEHLGLDFYIPGAWKEQKSGRSLEFVDPDGSLRLEAGGSLRSGRTVDQWLAARTQTLLSDMPYLRQMGEAYPIVGEDWGSRVEARVSEFCGAAPGTSEDKSVLVCCLRTDSVLACLVISAETGVFENNRALYKWLLPRANIEARMEDIIETGNTINEGLPDHTSLVASGHRMMIVAVLANAGFLSQAGHFHLFVVLYLSLCIAGFGCFGLYRITQGLQFPWWVKVLFFGGMFVPGLSLVLTLGLRWRARIFLKDAGYSIGLLGAGDAIHADNHDLRNTMIVALLLALPLYGLVHVAERRLGLEHKMAPFSPPDHSFDAIMPESPTIKPGSTEEQVWTSTAGGAEYNAGYTWVSGTADDPEQTLRDFARQRAKAMDWDVELNTADEVGEHEARLFEATTRGGKVVSAEFVLVEHRMFMFWIEVPEKDKDGPSVHEFLESLSVK